MSYLLALLAGALTIAAPCVLPMLPIVLGASIAQGGRARPALIALGFVLAFSASAIVFGLFTDSLGLSQQALRDGASALLLAFGLLMCWKRPFDLLGARLAGLAGRAAAPRTDTSKLGALVLGLALGVVWTPCAGPVLGSALTLIATQRDLAHAIATLLAYACGAGIPMLLIAYGGQRASAQVRRLAPHARRMQQAFGVLTMLTACAMYLQYDALVALWLADVAIGAM